MKWTSILAIYFLFWVMSAFFVLPIGVKTPDETGEKMVAGQADSAPSNFNGRRIVLRATALSLILFGAYYANYVNQWISVEALDLTR